MGSRYGWDLCVCDCLVIVQVVTFQLWGMDLVEEGFEKPADEWASMAERELKQKAMEGSSAKEEVERT